MFGYKKKQNGGSGNCNNRSKKYIMRDLRQMDSKMRKNVSFGEGNNIEDIQYNLYPSDGIWKGIKHLMRVLIPQEYPMKGPKVICKTRIYHPNIDNKGNVCLSILKDGWLPVYNLEYLFRCLDILFQDPNPDDPLDFDAAELFEKDYEGFVRKAKRLIQQ